MKKFRIKIVSALLLAFTFFMVHDYVIQHPADVQYTQLYLDANSMEDISEVHDKIHSVFHSSLLIITLLDFDSINTKPNTNEPIYLSHTSFIPSRPPAI
ncbi:MAG: hypothetical protein ACI9TV_001210 [Sulfurimonas sp.]|jgi:hypothetical protein|uniref:hypothetical protein n=1 Tax=Sulfurimonas sp. TaxID=2022749 RepID=UPI0039E3ED44